VTLSVIICRASAHHLLVRLQANFWSDWQVYTYVWIISLQGVHIQTIMNNSVSYYKGGYPSTLFLCSFYNTCMYGVFSSHFRIIFMFSIFADEVSHVSPFSKPFCNSSDAHNGFSIACMLRSISRSSWAYIQYAL